MRFFFLIRVLISGEKKKLQRERREDVVGVDGMYVLQVDAGRVPVSEAAAILYCCQKLMETINCRKHVGTVSAAHNPF